MFVRAFLTLALIFFIQCLCGLCQELLPNASSENPAGQVLASDVGNDVILVPVLQEALNDLVLTNLHNMVPNELVVFSGSRVLPTGVSINPDNLKILGTISVTNAVTFVDVPVEPTDGQVDTHIEDASENANSGVVAPVSVD